MARLVSLIGVPHDPTLPIAARLRLDGKAPPGAILALDCFEELRLELEKSRPDALVMVGSDHLNQWFFNNMAPFIIGKPERLKGPFPSEIRSWGLEGCDLPVHGGLARHMLKHGYEEGVDFAFSDEFIADHSFTIPLNFLRPGQDLPVVPAFVNLLAPPVPPGRRFAEVGRAMRSGIESFAGEERVALIVTGHMSNSVGGPGMLNNMTEPETDWDRAMWARIEANDVDAIVQHSLWDRLYTAGNGTPGFLAYLLAFGAALRAPPTYRRLIATTAQPACAFLAWDEAALDGGRA
ncbi:2,3-dihydroxybiphenyl 1,2-dioxygenase [Rhizobium rhizogenes]|uniref:DODA-type extradiol aromatic ring-opening family dioxygenase n=1 Tax=Rhizobium rhizogenes TaxID=359 RepID=UPI0015737AA2|nr:2,3-dihydroxybiphenyl 1,2-dioxygenase [Rhizobium rhizogenes]NTF98026.1 2,3-dihydroxybiphenyl 1,2-dioxygenase [Rhizobium rhizogenes]